MSGSAKVGLGEDAWKKLRELGWAALIAFLTWLVQRLASGGGSSSSDADSGQ